MRERSYVAGLSSAQFAFARRVDGRKSRCFRGTEMVISNANFAGNANQELTLYFVIARGSVAD